jgi:Ion channel
MSIVTYTTLGFGDVRPATLAGEIIVSSEVILGYTASLGADER